MCHMLQKSQPSNYERKNNFYFEKESYHEALVGLEPIMHSRLALNQRSACPCLLNARIKGNHHHTWLKKGFLDIRDLF